MGLGRKHRRGFQEIGYAFVLVKSSDVQEEPLSTDARSRPRGVAGNEVLIGERRREDCDFLLRNPSLGQPGDIAWRRDENSADPPKGRDSGGHVVCPPKEARRRCRVRHPDSVVQGECDPARFEGAGDMVVGPYRISVQMDDLGGLEVGIE